MTELVTESLGLSIGGKRVCCDFSQAFEAGQVWGVLGQNGVGKTTLLHTLAGLRQPDSGRILLNDKCLKSWPRRHLATHLGVLLQDIQDPFPATVLETALIGRHPHLSPWQFESEQDYLLATEALRELDMLALADRDVTTLSGGERQRLALATLLVQSPDIFQLDEPTNHLDLHYQVAMLELICQRAKKHQKLVIMTLHDINLAARFCDHLLFMLGDGEIAAGPAEALLTDQYLHRLYRHCIVEVEQNGRRAFLPG